MPALTQWLTGVLGEGHSTQTEAPALSADERPAVESLLRDAFATLQREVAGPPVAFDLALALRCLQVLAEACWHLTALPPESPLPPNDLGEPHSASDHLTGDLVLRYLVSVRKRATLRGAGDPLGEWCEGILRAWPLSGVSMGYRAGPTTPLTFDAHPGLMTLYAERLGARPEPAWVPPPGPMTEYLERAFSEAGRVIPVLPESPRE